MSAQMRRRFNAATGFRKIRPQDEGTEKRNCAATSACIARIRFIFYSKFHSHAKPAYMLGPVAQPSTKIFGRLHRLTRVAANFSGKFALAAKPQVFLGFQLRHSEQMAQHVEFVVPREPGEIRRGLRNEGCSLIRPALLAWFIGSRTLVLARRYALPPSPCLGQKTYIQNRAFLEKYLF